MSQNLIQRLESLGHPRILVLGDVVLERNIWGTADRLCDEAPVPWILAERREHRLGGAAGVAARLRALGAEVRLAGAVGRDSESVLIRKLLAELGIDDRLLLSLDDRPTSVDECYLVRASAGGVQPVMRVAYGVSDPLPHASESEIWGEIPEVVASSDLVLVCDSGRGVCTSSLLGSLITACRSLDAKVIVDPCRSNQNEKYQGVHAMIPSLREAEVATGLTIREPSDALAAGRTLLQDLRLECVLITGYGEGLASVQSDGREMIVPLRTRNLSATACPGEMVLAMTGLCLAGGGDYEEAAALACLAEALEAEQPVGQTVDRRALLRNLLRTQPKPSRKVRLRSELLRELDRRREAGQSIVFWSLPFDRLEVGHLQRLHEAQTFGDHLAVGLKLPPGLGESQLRDFLERPWLEILEAVDCVDSITLYDETTPLDLIQEIQPQVVVAEGELKEDSDALREVVESWGGRLVESDPMGHSPNSHKQDRHSNSRLRQDVPASSVPTPHGLRAVTPRHPWSPR